MCLVPESGEFHRLVFYAVGTHLVAVFSGNCEQEHAGSDDVLFAMPPPVLGHHHLLAPLPHAVQKTVLAELVLVIDALLLGLAWHVFVG